MRALTLALHFALFSGFRILSQRPNLRKQRPLRLLDFILPHIRAQDQFALARARALHNFFFGLKREAGLIFAQHAALAPKLLILSQRFLPR